MSDINGSIVLITGGTGSFGRRFARRVLEGFRPQKVIVYSRDEYKQYLMQKEFESHKKTMRFFIGDVRDRDRLARALEGVDYLVHAAALKQVPAAEYNPFEAAKTNIWGAQNVIDAAIDRRVKKVIALSTDKAVNPINLYGATKLVSDKLFISSNAYSGGRNPTFSVVRYGNVAGSRGSVIPFFRSILDRGGVELPITDEQMTRFWITLDQAVDLVIKAIHESRGGETYISKIPSFRITDLARAMAPEAKLKIVGLREGEKLHEVMITEYDSFNTFEYGQHFIIYPHFEWWDRGRHFTEGGTLVAPLFRYSSDSNREWLGEAALRERLATLEIGHPGDES